MGCSDVTLSAAVKRIVPISPLADLQPISLTAMNADLRLDPAEIAQESPALLPLRQGVEAHVWVGAQERPAFLWQARLLSEAWSCPWTPESGKHHFDIIDGLTGSGFAAASRLSGLRPGPPGPGPKITRLTARGPLDLRSPVQPVCKSRGRTSHTAHKFTRPNDFKGFTALLCNFFAGRTFPRSAPFRARRPTGLRAKPLHLGIDGARFLGRAEPDATIAGQSRKRHPPELRFMEIAAALPVIPAQPETHVTVEHRASALTIPTLYQQFLKMSIFFPNFLLSPKYVVVGS